MMDIREAMKKVAIFTVNGCYRLSCNHPFFVGMLVFIVYLYRSFPFLFFLLVSGSPVLVCTAILLGTLLSFGKPHIPEIERDERKASDIVSSKAGFSETNVVFGGNVSENVERNGDNRKDVVEQLVTETSRVEFDDKIREERRRDFVDRELESKSEIFGLGENGIVEDHYSLIPEVDDEQLDLENDRSPACSVDSKVVNIDSLDSLPCSPFGHVNQEDKDDESLDSDSDGAESSSPDASMADILPVLDELHPLLDEDASSEPSISDESDNDAEKQVSKDAQNDNEDGEEDKTKSAVRWTKEDERNLMDLGSSELERNQRLENLIARRRSRKTNLIDLESTAVNFNVPHILTTRNNPFNNSQDSYQDMGLPPIPGSAPSVLLHRRNPFDIPYDSSEEKPDLMEDSFQQEFTKEHFFRRHESFNAWRTPFGNNRPEKSRFRPFFVAEHLGPEGTSYSHFQRQLSGISDSMASSVPETGSIGSSENTEEWNVTEEETSEIEDRNNVEEETSVSDIKKNVSFSERVTVIGSPEVEADGVVDKEMEAGSSEMIQLDESRMTSCSDVQINKQNNVNYESSKDDKISACALTSGVIETEMISNPLNVLSSDSQSIPDSITHVEAMLSEQGIFQSNFDGSDHEDMTLTSPRHQYPSAESSGAYVEKNSLPQNSFYKPSPEDHKEPPKPDFSVVESIMEASNADSWSKYVITQIDDKLHLDFEVPSSPESTAVPTEVFEFQSVDEVDEIKDIDDQLLEELDSVGDFHVEEFRELDDHVEFGGSKVYPVQHDAESSIILIEKNLAQAHAAEQVAHAEDVRADLDSPRELTSSVEASDVTTLPNLEESDIVEAKTPESGHVLISEGKSLDDSFSPLKQESESSPRDSSKMPKDVDANTYSSGEVRSDAEESGVKKTQLSSLEEECYLIEAKAPESHDVFIPERQPLDDSDSVPKQESQPIAALELFEDGSAKNAGANMESLGGLNSGVEESDVKETR